MTDSPGVRTHGDNQSNAGAPQYKNCLGHPAAPFTALVEPSTAAAPAAATAAPPATAAIHHQTPSHFA